MLHTLYIQPVCKLNPSLGLNSEQEDDLTINPMHLKMKWGKGRMMRDCQLTVGCFGTMEHDDSVCIGSTPY
jgi:hypothetical protein